MPHPKTMPFAWEDEVLRCARTLVCIFLLALIVLIGGSVLITGAGVSGVSDQAASDAAAVPHIAWVR